MIIITIWLFFPGNYEICHHDYKKSTVHFIQVKFHLDHFHFSAYIFSLLQMADAINECNQCNDWVTWLPGRQIRWPWRSLSLLSFSRWLSRLGGIAEIFLPLHVPACQLPGAQRWLGVLSEGSQPGLHEELKPDVEDWALLHLPGQKFALSERKLWASLFGAASSFRAPPEPRDFSHLLPFHLQLEGADLYYEHQDSFGQAQSPGAVLCGRQGLGRLQHRWQAALRAHVCFPWDAGGPWNLPA